MGATAPVGAPPIGRQFALPLCGERATIAAAGIDVTHALSFGSVAILVPQAMSLKSVVVAVQDGSAGAPQAQGEQARSSTTVSSRCGSGYDAGQP